MVRIFFHKEGALQKTENIGQLSHLSKESILWVDLHLSSEEETETVQAFFSIDFFKLKSENEAESNSRFYERENLILIHSNFISKEENGYENTPVFFYLFSNILITERNAELATFHETMNKIQRNQKTFKDGSEILELILETKVDIDADFIEKMAAEIAVVRKELALNPSFNKEEILLKISNYQEAFTLTRESFFEKQRVISSLLKSNNFEKKERLKILIKDVAVMLEYCAFVFARMEYLQNTVLGLINLEQNKSIKIFTIVTVVFMPPSLIASLYGMNFKFMPELNWPIGYPIAILMMLLSCLLTLYIFKRKKWF